MLLTPFLCTQIAFATLGGSLAFKHIPVTLTWRAIAMANTNQARSTL